MKFLPGQSGNPRGASKKRLQPRDLSVLTELASRGVHLPDIARAVGFGRNLFREYLATHEEAQNAIDEGRQMLRDKLVNALVTKALNGDTIALIFACKCLAGLRENDQPNDSRPQVTINLPGAMSVEQYAKGLTIEHKDE